MREAPTVNANSAASTTAGQRKRVCQHSSTTTIASVAEPIAWPLGKLKVCSGAMDSHSAGLSRWKNCLVAMFSSADPPSETPAKVASRQRRATSRPSVSAMSAGTTPHW